MSTIAEKLVQLNDSKQAIKDAIEAKGVTVGDAPLAEYADKIEQIEESRYGATLDTFLGQKLNGAGEILAGKKINIELNGVKSIKAYGLHGAFAYSRTVGSISAPDLTKVADRGFSHGCYNSLCGASVSLPVLATIEVWGFFNAFAGASNVVNVDLSSLQQVGDYGMYYAFDKCSALLSVRLFSLQTAGMYGLADVFQGCYKLQEIDLSALQSIGRYGLYEAFGGCSALTKADLSSLQQVPDSGMQYTFSQCTALEEVKLDSLATVTAGGMNYCFQATSSNPGVLKRIDFPSLFDVSPTAFGNGTSYYAFRYRTTLEEIHFMEAARVAVEAMTGYADKWGATNATIYFDLPNKPMA